MDVSDAVAAGHDSWAPVRIEHVARRRELQVLRVEDLTPTTRRLVLGGPDLEADFPFHHLATTEHVKLAVPDPASGPDPASAEPALRSYTVRRFAAETRELTLDALVHPHGPAGRWVAAARPGASVGVLGPRSSTVHPDTPRRYVLVADPTALPAAERFCEELPASTAITLLALGSADDERPLGPPGRAAVSWLPAGDPAPAIGALRDLDLDDSTLVWGAGEAGLMRAVREHLRGDPRLTRDQVLVRGYWREGWAGSLPREDR